MVMKAFHYDSERSLLYSIIRGIKKAQPQLAKADQSLFLAYSVGDMPSIFLNTFEK